jgi:hypothetical protein
MNRRRRRLAKARKRVAVRAAKHEAWLRRIEADPVRNVRMLEFRRSFHDGLFPHLQYRQLPDPGDK